MFGILKIHHVKPFSSQDKEDKLNFKEQNIHYLGRHIVLRLHQITDQSHTKYNDQFRHIKDNYQ